jgi:hypothetical protein
MDFHFGVLRVEGPKALHQDSRNEVRSPEKVESLVVGQRRESCREFDISGFLGNRESGFQRSWSRVA